MWNGAHLHLQVRVHVVSLCYHGNTEQSITEREREGETGELVCLSPCTIWGFSHSLQGFLLIINSHVLKSVSPFYSLSVNCHITFTIIYTNTSNKAQDVNVLLFLISATATELIIIIDLIGQTLQRRWLRLIWTQPRECCPYCQNSLHASWLSDTSLTKRELCKLNFFLQYAKSCCLAKYLVSGVFFYLKQSEKKQYGEVTLQKAIPFDDICFILMSVSCF